MGCSLSIPREGSRQTVVTEGGVKDELFVRREGWKMWWKSHILFQRVRKRFARRIRRMSQNLDLNLQITNFCSTLPTDKLKNAIL